MNEKSPAYELKHLKEWIEKSPPNDPLAVLSVFGDPVKHSLSPHMHNPALKICGINGEYIKIRVPEVNFTEALGLIRELGFHGTNCTIPLKFAALNACDHIDKAAQRMGAVNTISFENNKINIETEDPDNTSKGKEQILCEYSGEGVNIGFNGQYLLEMLNHVDDEAFIIKFDSALSAVMIETEKEGSWKKTNLLMPIRIS